MTRVSAVAFTLMIGACSHDLQSTDELTVGSPLEVSRVVSAREALNGAHIPEVDPATMNYAEIARAIDSPAFCSFRYSSVGRPVLAVTADPTESPVDGVIKLNGSLVLLDREASKESLVLRADEIRLSVIFTNARARVYRVADRPREAQLVFEIGQRLRTGYLGYYACRD